MRFVLSLTLVLFPLTDSSMQLTQQTEVMLLGCSHCSLQVKKKARSAAV
jgi:hypothetical protein